MQITHKTYEMTIFFKTSNYTEEMNELTELAF